MIRPVALMGFLALGVSPASASSTFSLDRVGESVVEAFLNSNATNAIRLSLKNRECQSFSILSGKVEAGETVDFSEQKTFKAQTIKYVIDFDSKASDGQICESKRLELEETKHSERRGTRDGLPVYEVIGTSYVPYITNRR